MTEIQEMEKALAVEHPLSDRDWAEIMAKAYNLLEFAKKQGCDVTAGMKKHRVRQITMIDENSFSVVMIGGNGWHKTYGSTVGEAINEGLAERDEWERNHK